MPKLRLHNVVQLRKARNLTRLERTNALGRDQQATREIDMQTYTLDALGATITYDVRGDVADGTPERPLLMTSGA